MFGAQLRCRTRNQYVPDRCTCPTLFLWRKGPTTGLWRVARDVTPETADAWLKVFQADEPTVKFRVSKHKPKST